jgi:hypothetical protein
MRLLHVISDAQRTTNAHANQHFHQVLISTP